MFKTKISSAPTSLKEAWIAMAGLSAVFLFEMLDNSILNVALPTIGEELKASNTTLQWITGVYSLIFGGLMLPFGALSDRYGRRIIMLIGLVILGLASFAILFVTNAEQLLVLRAITGLAAAMTTPGTMALAFTLFATQELKVKATTVISTVGLVGLAIAPAVGGFILAVAPWQALLLINVPVAILAFLGIKTGISPDKVSEMHKNPLDIIGSLLGAISIVFALLAPTLFVNQGYKSWYPWLSVLTALLGFLLFISRENRAKYPLLDLKLLTNPLVSSGLAFKAASSLAVAGMGYLVVLQLQLEWGWTPGYASLGMLPQVLVLILGGVFVDPFVKKLGMNRAAWISTITVIVGLIFYALFSNFGYVWVAVALVLVAAGMRIVGVVAGINMLNGLPKNRTGIGSAIMDTVSEGTSGIGIAVAGTTMAAIFTGNLAVKGWSRVQINQFETSITVASLILAAIATLLVIWGMVQNKKD